MRAQISIEMILILAAILAVAFILVTQLQKTATKAGQMVENRSEQILSVGEQAGQACQVDADCEPGQMCIDNQCV